jgi:hypothetical protein
LYNLYTGSSGVDDGYVDFEKVFNARSVGAMNGEHLATRALKALSTVINIPALTAQTKQNSDALASLEPSVVYFPVLDKLTHSTFLEYGFGVNVDKILLTPANFETAMNDVAINWNYLNYLNQSKSDTGNSLNLTRDSSGMYLTGSFSASDQTTLNTLKSEYENYGYTFNCSALTCTSNQNKVVPTSAIELIKGQ